MADFLSGKGRRIMGWDEIPEDGAIRQDAVAMVRRADNGKLTRAVQAAKMGHDVVLCPTFYCYFDYSQGKEPEGTDFYNAIGAHLRAQLPYLDAQRVNYREESGKPRLDWAGQPRGGREILEKKARE